MILEKCITQKILTLKILLKINLKYTENRKKMIKKVIICAVILVSASSCVAVKEYEKIYINDPDMILSAALIKRFETNFQVYREGASGANGGKTGGGCGCN